MMTLLIIEDEGPIRELLVEMLGDEGYLVQSVSNGQEALAALRRRSKLLA
jgi:CheY-like chemotaxis protein